MSKKNLMIFLGSFVFFGAIGSYALHANLIHLPIERRVEVSLATDFSDDQKLVGASHHVFVGKVIKQVSTIQNNSFPETQFSVQIIDNIKGDLQGVVTVNQEGGYKNGILYTLYEGDIAIPKKEEANGLLRLGSTYLMATRFDPDRNWHTLIASPFGSRIMSDNNKLNNEELRLLVQQNERVAQLQEAYKNEILLEADLKNQNTINSYQSLFGGK